MEEIKPTPEETEQVLALQETPAAESDDEVLAHGSTVSLAGCCLD